MTASHAPASPAGPSPLRRPGSIRRTSAVDSSWPDGVGEPTRMAAVGRDLYTPPGGARGRTLDEARVDFRISPRREILEIRPSPDHPAAQRMVGARAGGHSRVLLAEIMPEERRQGALVHLLIDDFAGASLVANWAPSRWMPDSFERVARAMMAGGQTPNFGRNGTMASVCAGFAPGTTALDDGGRPRHDIQNTVRVPPLPHPDDPDGWHHLPEQEGIGMRRARRLDIWIADGLIHMDAGFQDTGTMPDGGLRAAIHEYRVRATAGLDDHVLRTLDVTPHILPYRECPNATPNAQVMVGVRLEAMRTEVLGRLPGTQGCTHLNDVLRSLADAPALARALQAQT